MGNMEKKYKRIVIKAGTAVLTKGEEHTQLNENSVNQIVDQIVNLVQSGHEVVFISSGAIAAGREIINHNPDNQTKKNIVSRQVLAAIGQSRLMNYYQEAFGKSEIFTAQTLLTSNDLTNRQSYLNIKNTLLSLLNVNVLPILNENDVVAVEEISTVFGDNDRLSALVANLIDADLLIILSDTDGLYDKDPNVNETAVLVEEVSVIDDSITQMIGNNINPWARGGMVTKIEAARLVTSAGIPMILCNGNTHNVLIEAAAGNQVGTLFRPKEGRLESRKTWMLAIVTSHQNASITVDLGAEVALNQNASLLPSGITTINGEFNRGDVIYINTASKPEPFACGITNYSSNDIKKVLGKQSKLIESELGYNYGEEIIHKDNLITL
ncbi:MAG TPA: glutamate 5-kinase [Dehalococcoidia bacterium]|nr:glutamate 5-kinase [Dehalococcoidia bacterium]